MTDVDGVVFNLVFFLFLEVQSFHLWGEKIVLLNSRPRTSLPLNVTLFAQYSMQPNTRITTSCACCIFAGANRDYYTSTTHILVGVNLTPIVKGVHSI